MVNGCMFGSTFGSAV